MERQVWPFCTFLQFQINGIWKNDSIIMLMVFHFETCYCMVICLMKRIYMQDDLKIQYSIHYPSHTPLKFDGFFKNFAIIYIDVYSNSIFTLKKNNCEQPQRHIWFLNYFVY